jgi:hypothetical protein
MTEPTGAVTRPRIADLVRAAGRKVSDQAHAAADDRARVLGWEITKTPGVLGLGGRAYRDSRFAARRPIRQDLAAGKARAS